MRKILGSIAIVAMVASPAMAIPTLQLYIEGAAYDQTSETFSRDGFTGIRLWVIGTGYDKALPPEIADVKLAAAYNATASNVTITLKGSVVNDSVFAGFNDNTTPQDVLTPWIVDTVGGTPDFHFSNGQDPAHGIYGVGTTWQGFQLGDFTGQVEVTPDFLDFVNSDGTIDTPTGSGDSHLGQINVYDVMIAGTGLEWLHFDAYDHITTQIGPARAPNNKISYEFAPFSHDAEGNNVVPAPGAALLVVIGLGLVGWVKKRLA